MPARGSKGSSVPSDEEPWDAEQGSSTTMRSPPTHMPSVAEAPETHADEDTEPRSAKSVREPLAGVALPHTVEARLDVIRSSDARRSYLLTTVRTTIGRGHDADVIVNDPRASRRHASIFYTGTEFRIRDESSINGTLLNGSRVVEYAIRDGDELLVGDTLLRFRIRRHP